MSEERPLIVGVGNALRGDDGVGPFVAEALSARGLATHVHAGDGTGLIDLFETHDQIVLIDATRSGTDPGTLIVLDAVANKLPADLFHYSTHRFGLAEAVETARALGTLPEHLQVYGIEGADFSAGDHLSPAVRETAEKLIDRIAETVLGS
ncbi:hydrogenase maturation protease [uncultured Roseibium sp.]|uniref:hydrogenase maturation protease n=1 Tax=uncultured Roseibium sp. TaxID=1936171 RepID=UPI003216F942